MKTAGILLVGILALCAQLQLATVAAGGTGECLGGIGRLRRAGSGQGSHMGRAGKTDHIGTEPGTSSASGHPMTGRGDLSHTLPLSHEAPALQHREGPLRSAPCGQRGQTGRALQQQQDAAARWEPCLQAFGC